MNILLLLLAGCSDLPPLLAGTCGNGVVESGEDCDTVAAAGLACGAPTAGVKACRFVCDDNACPKGWGCGGDRVCRFARGRSSDGWAPVSGSPWDLPSATLAVGDVDGDGVVDVLGFAGTRFGVRFGAGDGRLSAQAAFAIEFPLSPPAFGRLDDDGRLDAVVALPSGVATLRGTATQTLATETFPAFYSGAGGPEIFVAVRGPKSDGDDLLHIAGGAIYRFNKALLADDPDPVPLPDGFTAADLIGRVPVADLDRDGFDDFVLVFAGGRSAYQYELGLDDRGVVPLLRATIPLPAPAQAGGGALFADVDGDGLLDLLVGVKAIAGGIGVPEATIAVGAATAPGVFAAPAIDTELDLTAAGCGTVRWPLAAADLDGDGRTDFVGSLGVCLNRGAAGLARTGDNPSPNAWTTAAIGDFNGDGHLDVAGASDMQTNVDFLFSDPRGSGFFNYARGVTDAPLQLLRAGDFDGDFVDDVALVDSDGRLSVIFGAASGAPPPAQPMGQFGAVAALEPADLYFATTRRDRTKDLIVEDDAAAPRAFTFMIGNAQRAMSAAYPLRVSSEATDLPLSTVLADFDGDGSTDAAVFAFDGSPESRNAQRLWVLLGDGKGGWRDARRSTPVPNDVFVPTCAAYYDAPLLGAHAPHEALVLANSCGASIAAIGLIQLGADGLPSYSGINVLDALVAPNDAALVDLDDDGVTDLVVVSFLGNYFSDSGEGTHVPGAGLMIMTNHGGALDPNAADTVIIKDFPGARVAPFAATAMNVDADPDKELVVLTSGGLYVIDPGTGYSVAGPVLQTGVAYGNKLVAVDLNGDHLDDLVFNGVNQVHAYLAVGATAADAP